MGAMATFEYLIPKELGEAITLITAMGDSGRVLAGGTEILVEMKEKGLSPGKLVDIKQLNELKGIDVGPGGILELGSLTTLHEIETSYPVKSRWPSLSEAASLVGSYQIRNRATIGGNICGASPASDTAPALIALKAVANIAGPAGERSIDLEQFFKDRRQTVLQRGELLKSLTVPPQAAKSGSVYLKHSLRNAMDIAIVGVAASITLDGIGVCRDARIVLGAVAPVPIRARSAEALLKDKAVSKELIAQAASLAGQEAKPISNLGGTAEYRRKMVVVYVRRALAATVAGLS